MKQLVYSVVILEYTTAIWYSLWPFGNLVVIWYISSRFGILNKVKSGNPGFITKDINREPIFCLIQVGTGRVMILWHNLSSVYVVINIFHFCSNTAIPQYRFFDD
jgi:hypothetical protein